MNEPAGSELGPATIVSGYRVEALIGRGGMGAVYRASDDGLGRKVALKVIAPELASDERFRERFLRESRMAASLDHPHVVPIYQSGEEGGLLFIAMRYVEGTDLGRLLAAEGVLEPGRALALLSQVAEALDAAHAKGLVHRDVKPSNVLIAGAAGSEHCYLADFGLTRRTGSASGTRAAGEVVGTLEYIAPEQITGDDLDARSDLYSFACVLYECLTGQVPFPRATDVALLWAHVHEEPTPASKARPQLPEELDTVLARALAKEPGGRYGSAGELVAATAHSYPLGGVSGQAEGSSTKLRLPASVVVGGRRGSASPVVSGSRLTKPRRQERKVITCVFCSLTSASVDELDVEDVAALIGAYQARVEVELERHGGTVEKVIGEAVMAVFGAPIAHEDDPERAVRAALAIRAYAKDEGIELRVGIATGEALVTLGARPEQGETIAAGEIVNTAARLQAAAPRGGILVGERTFEATKHVIDYRAIDPVKAKGKARPIPAREALRARSRVRLDRMHTTPLVGRARELDVLVDALARARAERQPQLVTLVGVPGMGKSRLVYELAQVADRDAELISWRQGRCLPYGDGVSVGALAEIVKPHLGILDTDAAEVVEEKLRGLSLDGWVRAQLRPLVGLGVQGVQGVGDGDGDRREQAFAAWGRFLEDIAADGPLTLVFEDLHWADETLLDFVDHLVDWSSSVPMLVVCTARPELLARRPGWGGGKVNSQTMSLAPLSDVETSRLVGRLIQKSRLPADAQEALLARVGGNPLYAEQYARLLKDRVSAELELPETVQGVIAARLDVLDPIQKALLQDAAVVGKTFWLGALTSISGVEKSDAELSLHDLDRKGFVRRERETSIAGDIEYAFLHVLVRDVAYGQIPRAPRSEKHRQTAQWIESLGRIEDDAETLAHHYLEALALARAAGLETVTLEKPARRALGAAGDRALALNAYAAALRFYEQALELDGDRVERARLLFQRTQAHRPFAPARTDLFAEARDALLAVGDPERAAEAQMQEALALRTRGRVTDALEAAKAAAALLEDAPPTVAKGYVLANRARLLTLMHRNDAIEVGREALEIAEHLRNGELKAMALNSIGLARVLTGDFGGIGEMEESLDLAREHGSPYEITRVYNNLGAGYTWAGQVDRAYEIHSQQLELCERFGLDVLWPKAVLAWAAYATGRWEEATRYADELLAADAPIPGQAHVYICRGVLRLARDDLAGAASDFERGFDLAEEYGEGQPAYRDARRILCAAQLAQAEGRREATDTLASELHDVVRGAVDRQVEVATIARAMVDIALLFTDLERPRDVLLDAAHLSPHDPWLAVAAAVAQRELEPAADRLAEMGARTLEAAVRLRAATTMVAEGRRAEADAQLAKALLFYRSVGATRYIREGEALIAATA